MTIQTPTRITIEVHPPEPGSSTPHVTIAAEPREEAVRPALYEPAPCTCLDDGEDCAADHANE
jgi:hypothetical protein